MVDRRTPAERRDDLAADRDDAAEARGVHSDSRDDNAEQRDADAEQRDAVADLDAEDLDLRFAEVRAQILDRFRRDEDATLDAAEWPNLTPSGLARLRAHADEQRRLASADRIAAARLIDDLHERVRRFRGGRAAAARDRTDAAHDRHHSEHNRHDSAHDRDLAARDRDQSAIERELADPSLADTRPGPQPPPPDPVAETLEASRRRITDSRGWLDRTQTRTASPQPDVESG